MRAAWKQSKTKSGRCQLKCWWNYANPTCDYNIRTVDINHGMHVWLLCEMLKMRGDENWIKLCVAAHCREVIRDKHWDAESDLSCWRLSEIGAVSPSIPVAQWLEFPNVGLMGCQPGAEPLHRTSHNNKWSKIKLIKKIAKRKSNTLPVLMGKWTLLGVDWLSSLLLQHSGTEREEIGYMVEMWKTLLAVYFPDSQLGNALMCAHKHVLSQPALYLHS